MSYIRGKFVAVQQCYGVEQSVTSFLQSIQADFLEFKAACTMNLAMESNIETLLLELVHDFSDAMERTRKEMEEARVLQIHYQELYQKADTKLMALFEENERFRSQLGFSTINTMQMPLCGNRESFIIDDLDHGMLETLIQVYPTFEFGILLNNGHADWKYAIGMPRNLASYEQSGKAKRRFGSMEAGGGESSSSRTRGEDARRDVKDFICAHGRARWNDPPATSGVAAGGGKSGGGGCGESGDGIGSTAKCWSKSETSRKTGRATDWATKGTF